MACPPVGRPRVELAPGEVPLALLPGWVPQYLRERHRGGAAGACRSLTGSATGWRHDTYVSAARSMAKAGFPGEAIFAALKVTDRLRGAPPKNDDDELRRDRHLGVGPRRPARTPRTTGSPPRSGVRHERQASPTRWIPAAFTARSATPCSRSSSRWRRAGRRCSPRRSIFFGNALGRTAHMRVARTVTTPTSTWSLVGVQPRAQRHRARHRRRPGRRSPIPAGRTRA